MPSINRGNRIVLNSILISVVALVPLLASCTKTDEPTATTTQPPVTTTVPPVTTTTSPPLTTLAGIDGGLVYLSHCAACHGINRQGVITGANLVGPPVAPANLSGFTDAALSAFSVVHLKSKTNVDLPAAQANNLAIFMKTVPPATTTPPPTTTPPATTPATTPPATTSAVNAAQLYANSCAVCHGANRQGVIVGTTVLGPPVLVTSPSVASRTEAQLTSYILTHQTGALLDPDQRAALVKMLKAP